MEKDLITASIWRLARREHELLSEVMPIFREMRILLDGGLKPYPEQLRKFLSLEEKVNRTMQELSEASEAVDRIVQKPPYSFEA